MSHEDTTIPLYHLLSAIRSQINGHAPFRVNLHAGTAAKMAIGQQCMGRSATCASGSRHLHHSRVLLLCRLLMLCRQCQWWDCSHSRMSSSCASSAATTCAGYLAHPCPRKQQNCFTLASRLCLPIGIPYSVAHRVAGLPAPAALVTAVPQVVTPATPEMAVAACADGPDRNMSAVTALPAAHVAVAEPAAASAP